DVHHDIVGGVAELVPVAFRAELLRMGAHGRRVRAQALLAPLVIGRIAGIEKRVERTLRVDDQLAAARQPDNHIGAQHAVIGIDDYLLLEIGKGRQPGLFEDVAEALLAPAAPRLGACPQRIYKPRSLLAYLPLADPD